MSDEPGIEAEEPPLVRPPGRIGHAAAYKPVRESSDMRRGAACAQTEDLGDERAGKQRLDRVDERVSGEAGQGQVLVVLTNGGEQVFNPSWGEPPPGLVTAFVLRDEVRGHHDQLRANVGSRLEYREENPAVCPWSRLVCQRLGSHTVIGAAAPECSLEPLSSIMRADAKDQPPLLEAHVA